MGTNPTKLGILISGGGTTMLNLHEQIANGSLDAEIVCVISSRSDVKGVGLARELGYEPEIVRKKDYADIDTFSTSIAQTLRKSGVELVIQAGWLCLWKIYDDFEGRVMNIHPALLPSFGGKGMWGRHVHEAVLKAGCKISGCTVHFCTNEYDKGPIIVQKSCPVYDTDTPEQLAARVFEQESLAYPEAVRLFTQGRLKIDNSIVRIARQ
ncbi:Phosphoribosylglycinamide formyltransferase [Limihaloglobus sulfuriphilus]|uniref:Phosphoribosylglycinamide formyltransferase n=1 Tax=Limihaloglobus sulfuriphilus TaxID=1851148 RepID=A0A1Q2MDV2_9BACT|nr:phosphoribosylglycinamide formyltransferase [Limihaloglobus sulfuriphilus]AQQ70824.1 Phosphoribosylglycinamide formyltransferase [Limihaloglobus sulfuriphilus]